MTQNLADLRKGMDSALKADIVPLLRDSGFRGSYPNFYRLINGRNDLLSFGFDKYGGAFTIALGRCAAGDFTTYWGKTIPAGKMRIAYLDWKSRTQLGPSGFDAQEATLYPGFVFRYGRIADCIGQVSVRLPDAMNWFEKPRGDEPG